MPFITLLSLIVVLAAVAAAVLIVVAAAVVLVIVLAVVLIAILAVILVVVLIVVLVVVSAVVHIIVAISCHSMVPPKKEIFFVTGVVWLIHKILYLNLPKHLQFESECGNSREMSSLRSYM